MTEEHLAYVRDRLAQGDSLEMVQKRLAAAGYTDAQITELVSLVRDASSGGVRHTNDTGLANTSTETPWSFFVTVLFTPFQHLGTLGILILSNSVWFLLTTFVVLPFAGVVNVLGAILSLFVTVAVLALFLRSDVPSFGTAVVWSLRHIVSSVWITAAFVLVLVSVSVLPSLLVMLAAFVGFDPMAVLANVYSGDWLTAAPSILLVFFVPLTIFVLFTTLSVYTYIDFAAFVAEDKRGFWALARSAQLVAGHWWKVFGRVLLVGIAVLGILLLAAVLGLLAGHLEQRWFGEAVYSLPLVQALAVSVLQLMYAAVVVGLYQWLCSKKTASDVSLSTVRKWLLRSLLVLPLGFLLVLTLFLVQEATAPPTFDGPTGPGELPRPRLE